jgi:hypothetical protein
VSSGSGADLPRAHEFDALIEPLHWGRSRYTIVRLPAGLVADARAQGTHRLRGEIEGVPVNLAVTKAPVVDDAFVYVGAALLRRVGAGAGQPVTCRLAPADPDAVDLPEDVEEALAAAGLLGVWEQLRPAARRRRLRPVDGVATPAARARRIRELLDGLPDAGR